MDKGYVNLTFFAAGGYCTGYSVKKLGKIAAFILGLEFLGLQALVKGGYVKVNWNKLAGDFSPTKARLKSLLRLILSIATYNLPYAMTFVAGFFAGFKMA